jgi:two-component system, NtrC family, sensor kinase
MPIRRSLLERLFPSLGRKLAAAVVLTLLVFGGAFVFMAQRTGYSMLSQQAELRALTMAELMEAMLEHAMLEGTPDHARHALTAALGTSIVANAYLLKNSGAILFAARPVTGPGRIGLEGFQDLGTPGGQKYLSVKEQDSLFEYILVPIVKKPACYTCHREPVPTQGFFAVKLRVDDLRAMSSGHRVTNILMTLATFLGLGVVLYIALSVLIIKPIRSLHHHIRTVEREVGHLGKGARLLFPQFSIPRGRDEITDLSRDFNSLVERLDVAYAELSHLHQTRLEQADRLASAGQMAAGMAHEIKNPVAGVLGALQVFEADLAPDDPRRDIFGEMKLQLERINHAVNDLLAFARPTPPVFENVQIDRMIERTLALFTPQFRDNNITLDTALQDGNVTVLADRKQLQQVLWNILLNAVQAMGAEGTLTVATRRVKARLDILVNDTGRGIAPENAAKIFEPFFTTKHKGTGLGMTISKRIMEQHGGSITVTSTPGVGTTVGLSLPLLNEEE